MRSTDTKPSLKKAPAPARKPATKPRDIDFAAVDAMVTDVLEKKPGPRGRNRETLDQPSYQFSEDELIEIGDLRVRRVPDDRIVMPQDLLNWRVVQVVLLHTMEYLVYRLLNIPIRNVPYHTEYSVLY